MSGEWVLQLDGPAGATPATCRWLVDATGRRSFIARRLGIAREDNDRLLAFAATFRPTTPGDVDSLSFVDSAADGWWYTALMPSGERVVVFFTDADEPAAVAAKSGSGFLAALATTRHVSQRVARFGYEMTGFPRGLDARSSRLERFHGPGWVAVGDAAVSFDPLSSQGLVAALDAGTKAGQALATELRDGAAMLGQYAEESAKGYQAFLDQRRRYYGYETRWSDRPFWERRQQSVKDINDSYR
jgi:flavin-dependent dehydrogenase